MIYYFYKKYGGDSLNIKIKAKRFACSAHSGQVRKSDKAKPMIIHPMDVANKLEEYGFDDNVIAGGYLHDVVEDTKYTKEDILKKFGEDIASLVDGASEKDKSLSWEERKKETIDRVKRLDLRHKAIVCCDKISNLEDIQILMKVNENFDFSAFKRGYEKQKWYYTEVYKSLIINEDINNKMFLDLKELIDSVFYNKKDTYLENTIFEDAKEELNKLMKYHYRKKEIFKLSKILKTKPYVIEFTGTPRTGKTTLINNLYDFFKKGGFNVEVIEEFTTSNKYKNEIYPKLKDKDKKTINLEIPKYVLKQLNEVIEKKPDIILIDRSLIDRFIWIDRLYLKKEILKEEYNEYIDKQISIIRDKIDLVIVTYTDSITCIKRDYLTSLSLEKRRFLNENNINEYNKSLLNIKKLMNKKNINFYFIDTTEINQRGVSFDVVDVILKQIRSEFIARIYDETRGDKNG